MDALTIQIGWFGGFSVYIGPVLMYQGLTRASDLDDDKITAASVVAT